MGSTNMIGVFGRGTLFSLAFFLYAACDFLPEDKDEWLLSGVLALVIVIGAVIFAWRSA